MERQRARYYELQQLHARPRTRRPPPQPPRATSWLERFFASLIGLPIEVSRSH